MLVLLVENAQESLRGELTRWLIEPKAGVSPDAGAILLYSFPGEQKFRIETWGVTRRRIRDFHGLQLVQRDHSDPDRARRKLQAKPPEGLPVRKLPARSEAD